MFAYRFLVNTSGISRLTKFYTPLHQSIQSVVQKIFSLVSTRPAGLCNFLDAPELEEFLGFKGDADERWRVVYRSYATLYFVFVVDGAESELGILDLIQVCFVNVRSSELCQHSILKVLVESLDRAFENVCELDLVFHFDEVGSPIFEPFSILDDAQVHHILAEIIQGGLVLETNVEEIDICGM